MNFSAESLISTLLLYGGLMSIQSQTPASVAGGGLFSLYCSRFHDPSGTFPIFCSQLILYKVGVCSPAQFIIIIIVKTFPIHIHKLHTLSTTPLISLQQTHWNWDLFLPPWPIRFTHPEPMSKLWCQLDGTYVRIAYAITISKPHRTSASPT